MKKDKHNLPGKGKKKEKTGARFIKFSKVQASYLNEMLLRQQRELNEAITTVYEDLGIAEKILQAPQGTYVLRKDFSGLDVVPVAPEAGEGEKSPAVPEEPGPDQPSPGKETEEEPVKEKAH